MGFGDLCYKTGGDLAYSKVDGQSLIYKGRWRITINWTGSYDDNTAYGAHTAVYTGARVSSYDWPFEGGGIPGMYRLLWSDSGVWVKNFVVGQSVFFTEPESYDAYVGGNAVVFYYHGYNYGYPGYIGRCFSNSSSDPEAAYSDVYHGPHDSRWTVADVSAILAWV